MILLDTNVISEPMTLMPSPQVMTWIASQVPGELWTCTIVVAEILSGLELMPRGRRQIQLREKAEFMFSTLFPSRVLDFDQKAAGIYGVVLSRRKAAGSPIDEMDALIAAITLAHGATLATRNIADFENCGVKLINPWA
jgi:toxin FitB